MQSRNRKAQILARIRIVVILGGAIAALALPAAADASNELAVTQAPSATLVNAGDTVTFKITVSNLGTEAYEAVFLSVSSLRGRAQGANNPYKSVSTSQGTCVETSGPAYGYYYYHFTCELGALVSGASAQLTAVVQVNESMNHFASLLPNAYSGGFQDDNNSNNEAADRITASTPADPERLEEDQAQGPSRGLRAGGLHTAGFDQGARGEKNGRVARPGLQ